MPFITKARCWLRQIAFRRSSDKDVILGISCTIDKITGHNYGEEEQKSISGACSHDTIVEKMFNCFRLQAVLS
jgi:hypothetical protein